MARAKSISSGWQGACLVGITYVHFLIFAQFAFLKRLAELGVAGEHLKAVMAAMAAGGILLSLLAPRIGVLRDPALRLRAGLAASAAAALLSLLPLGVAGAVAVSLLTGAGLGLLTVTLVSHLRVWTGTGDALLAVGLGTGLGYFVCNLPIVFNGSPQMQAVLAAALCLAGMAVPVAGFAVSSGNAEMTAGAKIPFWLVLASFAALVWLDSAAFFIIQNTPELKSGTWNGPLHLGANALVHLAAALLSVWLLRRYGLRFVLAAAFGALAAACVLLLDSQRAALASLLYPAGVSLYSVALVAYPSLLAPAATEAERGRRAGWIYALAGWIGSAMGIGMGQNLGYVPPAFLVVAGAVVLLPGAIQLLLRRKREAAAVAVLLCAALLLGRTVLRQPEAKALTQIERGRQVYVSEGCINCHSQYVRPNTADVLMWGPVQTMQRVHAGRPPLIGNRRQGPDLAEVGARRSALWLKAHFYDPPEVSGASVMPNYGFLFSGARGEDLVAYLVSLKTEGAEQHAAQQRQWRLSSEALTQADAADGKRAYQRHCATCHDQAGRTREEWRQSFKRMPPDLAVGPFFYLPPSGPAAERGMRLAQIARFGIPGTDMPGHEYLSDNQIASLSLWLMQNSAQPGLNP